MTTSVDPVGPVAVRRSRSLSYWTYLTMSGTGLLTTALVVRDVLLELEYIPRESREGFAASVVLALMMPYSIALIATVVLTLKQAVRGPALHRRRIVVWYAFIVGSFSVVTWAAPVYESGSPLPGALISDETALIVSLGVSVVATILPLAWFVRLRIDDGA